MIARSQPISSEVIKDLKKRIVKQKLEKYLKGYFQQTKKSVLKLMVMK